MGLLRMLWLLLHHHALLLLVLLLLLLLLVLVSFESSLHLVLLAGAVCPELHQTAHAAHPLQMRWHQATLAALDPGRMNRIFQGLQPLLLSQALAVAGP
jgi:hypothetical protein